jgi:hypothetical protein
VYITSQENFRRYRKQCSASECNESVCWDYYCFVILFPDRRNRGKGLPKNEELSTNRQVPHIPSPALGYSIRGWYFGRDSYAFSQPTVGFVVAGVSSGWKASVDGSEAFIDAGAGKSVDTVNIKDPIVAFLFGQRGLMANATIEGAKFSKLAR